MSWRTASMRPRQIAMISSRVTTRTTLGPLTANVSSCERRRHGALQPLPFSLRLLVPVPTGNPVEVWHRATQQRGSPDFPVSRLLKERVTRRVAFDPDTEQACARMSSRGRGQGIPPADMGRREAELLDIAGDRFDQTVLRGRIAGILAAMAIDEAFNSAPRGLQAAVADLAGVVEIGLQVIPCPLRPPAGGKHVGISPTGSEVTRMTFCLARVTATFNRRSPSD